MLPSKPSPFTHQPTPPPERFDEARKIDVRPRGSNAPKPAVEASTGEVMLNFSCPACLEMLITPRTEAQSAVQCPACEVWVMPPKVVNLATPVGSGKTMLPPPKKSGTQALRH